MANSVLTPSVSAPVGSLTSSLWPEVPPVMTLHGLGIAAEIRLCAIVARPLHSVDAIQQTASLNARTCAMRLQLIQTEIN